MYHWLPLPQNCESLAFFDSQETNQQWAQSCQISSTRVNVSDLLSSECEVPTLWSSVLERLGCAATLPSRRACIFHPPWRCLFSSTPQSVTKVAMYPRNQTFATIFLVVIFRPSWTPCPSPPQVGSYSREEKLSRVGYGDDGGLTWYRTCWWTKRS